MPTHSYGHAARLRRIGDVATAAVAHRAGAAGLLARTSLLEVVPGAPLEG